MNQQRGKYLIPCYKDIDAYNMPDEFLSLQSQNIDKLGFLQDLIRGIDKIFGRDKKQTRATLNETVSTSKYHNLLNHLRLELLSDDTHRLYKLLHRLIEPRYDDWGTAHLSKQPVLESMRLYCQQELLFL